MFRSLKVLVVRDMFGIEMRQWCKEVDGKGSVTHLGVVEGVGERGERGAEESELPPSQTCTSYFHFQPFLIQNNFLKSHVPTISEIPPPMEFLSLTCAIYTCPIPPN